MKCLFLIFKRFGRNCFSTPTVEEEEKSVKLTNKTLLLASYLCFGKKNTQIFENDTT